MREAAITALAALIATATEVKSVFRDSAPDGISSMSVPCVVLTDNGAEEIERKTGGMADVYVTLDLEIIVDAAKNQSTALNAVDKAVKAKIASNATLSGTVANVSILPQTSGDTSGAENTARRTRQVRIFYEASVASGM